MPCARSRTIPLVIEEDLSVFHDCASAHCDCLAGPRGLPLLGSALSIDPGRPWIKLGEWSKQYGPLMKVDVLGQPTIVISSAALAKQLLVKRATISSDRPRQVMADESVVSAANNVANAC